MTTGLYLEQRRGEQGALLPGGAFLHALTTAHGVEARSEGGTATLPTQWLRDNCPCNLCHIDQTDERRVLPWTVATPTVTSVAVENGSLEVIWADAHRSSYSEEWADGVNRALRRGSYTANLWHNGYELSRFDHDTVVADPVACRDLFASYVRDGAVVVENSPTVPGSVIDFMKKINLTLMDSSLGFIFDVKLDPDGYNVAFTNEELPLHNDNAQYAQPPSGQVLAMLVNEATGGESIVADGWCILEKLRAAHPEAIDALASVDVGFRQYSSHADGFWRSPLIARNSQKQFTHLRFSNQLMQPLAFDNPLVSDWYNAFRTLGEMIHAPENRVEFRLRGGDMLMVNGYRILHARKAFTADGPRHLQDVYFTAQDVFDNLARMSGDAVNAMVRS